MEVSESSCTVIGTPSLTWSIFKITSGKCPYRGIEDGEVELEEAIAEGNSAYTEDDLKEVEEVVAKCLQSFPGRRPQIRQVLDAIAD